MMDTQSLTTKGGYGAGPDGRFTRSDAYELFDGLDRISLENRRLRKLMGEYGRLLASGIVSFSPEQAKLIIPQLQERRDAVGFGWYDDYKGQIEAEGSLTQLWAVQLDAIIGKLESIAATAEN
jgi:ethanolamine utilization microcompartment shell protein EutS